MVSILAFIFIMVCVYKLSLFAYFVFPHSILICYTAYTLYPTEKTKVLLTIFIIAEIIILLITNLSKKHSSFRLSILISGKNIVYYGIYSFFIQSAFYIAYGYSSMNLGISNTIIIADSIFCAIFILLTFLDGAFRIILTSKWLSVIKRIVVIFLMPIPMLNVIALLYLCHVADTEFEYEEYKRENKPPISSNICKTKYPIVLIHGVGFRDSKLFNYWGRIPKELQRNGATIYYGNQEAWATIEYNANDIKEKILNIIEETDAEKVNIIAHSKGGLDSRYMISILGMEKYVASLTTVSTPHRGCKYADLLIRIVPSFIFKLLSKISNKYFSMLGDKSPDFYTVCHQFQASYIEKFNEKVLNSDKVYYQSYASVIKGIFSDYILLVPFIFISFVEGANDGLVSVPSAKWGEFKGVFKNKYRRGISHGDMIDLKREDYRGFDVIERYVDIVADLKEKGY